MDNSVVRKEILSQHGALRVHCSELSKIANALAEAPNSKGEYETLKRTLDQFWLLLDAHMAEEDRILLPALANVDAWGAERAKAFSAEHQQQRALFAAMKAFKGSAEELVAHVRQIVAVLIADMADEEKQFLGARLLSDFPEVGDQFTG